MSGVVARVAGPVVFAVDLPGTHLYDVVHVGRLGLAAEVIGLRGATTVLQVYEDTTGVAVGDPVVATGAPLQVELGPGLLGAVFDGVQRPLAKLAAVGDDPFGQPYLLRGVSPPALDRDRTWVFEPRVHAGDEVAAGDLLGCVAEGALEHRIRVPPGWAGVVSDVAAGVCRADTVVARVGGKPDGPLVRRVPTV